MKRWEKFVVLAFFCNLLGLLVVLSLFAGTPLVNIYAPELNEYEHFLVPWFYCIFVLDIASFVLTMRDLYLRDFPSPNDKLTWSLLIFWTGGIFWFIYLGKHAFHPRSDTDHSAAT